MKTTLLFLSALFSFNTFAANCPEINGVFTCMRGSQVSIKEITKTATGYIVVSDGVYSDYVTDGKTYDVEINEDVKDAKIKSYCQDNKFISDFTATILYEGSPIAKQVSKIEYSMKGANLEYLHKTKMKGLPMPTLRYTCTPSSLVN